MGGNMYVFYSSFAKYESEIYCFSNISTLNKLVLECSHCFKTSKVTLVKNLLKLIQGL